MEVVLTKKFTFEAGHYLPGHPKCGTQHGHSWCLKVSIRGKVKENGMVIDFSELKGLVDSYVINKLDHKNLNDVLDFTPTCEYLAEWIWMQLVEPLGLSGIELQRIKLSETPDNNVVYYGKD